MPDAHEQASRGPGERLSDRQDLPQPASSPIVAAVGDRIRFSTKLLRLIDDAPDQISQVVEIERVIRDHDGTLTLWLKNVGATVRGRMADAEAAR